MTPVISSASQCRERQNKVQVKVDVHTNNTTAYSIQNMTLNTGISVFRCLENINRNSIVSIIKHNLLKECSNVGEGAQSKG